MDKIIMTKTEARAHQIWAVLTYAASKSHVITYYELDKATGLVAGGMGNALSLVQEYCKHNKLPPITALVVNDKTGKPTNWGTTDMKRWPRVLRKIFTHKWDRKKAPKWGALKK